MPEIVLEMWTTLSEADSSTLTARWDELGSVMPQVSAVSRTTELEWAGAEQALRTSSACKTRKLTPTIGHFVLHPPGARGRAQELSDGSCRRQSQSVEDRVGCQA